MSGIADSGMVVRMTRGRAWIVVLGFLLGGIVALNVWGLGMSASNSATAAKIDGLQRNNSVLSGRIANRLSNGTIEATAVKLGLAVPGAGAVHYVNGGSGDADRAAERLTNGKIALGAPAVPVTEEIVDPNAIVVTDPATAPVDPATAPVDPAAPIEPVAIAPVEAVPVEPAPVEPVAAETAPVTTPVEPTAPVTGAVTP